MIARFLIVSLSACLLAPLAAPAAIVLENHDLRLRIAETGQALSLVEKATGQECLAPGTRTAAFALVVNRPNHTDFWVSYPSKRTTYAANRVRQEGDRLIVGFDVVANTVTLRVKTTNSYIAFTVEEVSGKGVVDEVRFLQLPLKNRKYFGDWLNVMWDESVAVNVLATGPYAQIDNDAREGYRLLWAGSSADVRLRDTGAALIATRTPELLGRIGRLEEDFGLPRGAESRQRPEYRWSQMLVGSHVDGEAVTPANIDRYLKYAKQGGFRAIQFYYLAFTKSVGHFEWRPEYTGKMDDLKAVVAKINAAGLLPGLHIHYNKARKNDSYVTPVPDPRLHLREIFTLAAPLGTSSTEVTVFENPLGATMDNERRYLKIEDELITYESYTTAPPYKFLGLQRGALKSTPAAHSRGLKFGVLDVDDWPIFVRYDQRTDIQEEVSRRVAPFYNEAGFRFGYFDGAEDVHPPYWFTTSWAQWQVYRLIKPELLFAEAAAHSHFGWHMMSRGNAFDAVEAEQMKQFIRDNPAAEAGRKAMDFTRINFGWLYIYQPSAKTIGSQVDIYEYAASRAAAWDCPISLLATADQLDAHPRTADILEGMRRWEQMRDRLTDSQRLELRNLAQEHTVVVNEKGALEIVPYEQLHGVAGTERPMRAFLFERNGKVYVTYWHISGEGTLDVPLPRNRVRLLQDLNKELPVEASGSGVLLPASNRRYLEVTGMSRAAVTDAFQKAVLR